MTIMTDPTLDTPVQKSITVRAPVERAFQVFTEELDSWWPRSHHIGKAPMTKTLLEGRVGGRCYSEQTDGTECDWGQILVWEPPSRFVMAWQINSGWQYEPDLAKSSEVEVRFIAGDDGTTRVDLEHRYFHRLGEGGAAMRTGVNAEGGWGSLLDLFAAKAEERS
jgi:uncharacterized protein YndB with AHSA1/START domain